MSVYYGGDGQRRGLFSHYLSNLFVSGFGIRTSPIDFRLENRPEALYILVGGDISTRGSLGRLNNQLIELVPPKKDAVIILEQNARYDTGFGALLIELRRRGARTIKIEGEGSGHIEEVLSVCNLGFVLNDSFFVNRPPIKLQRKTYNAY